MAGNAINIGSIEADLDIRTGNLEQGIAGARKAIDAIDAEVRRLDADFQAGSISLRDYTRRVTELTNTSDSLQGKMVAAYHALGVTNGGLDIFNKQTAAATSSSRNLGQGLMQLGYIADDVQYGFGAIVNNIGPLFLQFGMAAGMTGEAAGKLGAAAQVAAVATYQLYQRWDEVNEAFANVHPIDRAIQTIAELDKEIKKLKEDAGSVGWGDFIAGMAGFNSDAGKGEKAATLEVRAKARHAADANAKTLEGDHTDAEKKAAERFKDAVTESGGMDKLVGRIAGKNLEDKGWRAFLSQPERNELNRMNGFVGTDAQGRPIENRQSEMTDRERSRYNDLKGKGQRQAMDGARENIGGALYDADAQRRIGDAVGGSAGDLLSGRTKTEKEKKEAGEAAAKRATGEEKDIDQQIKDRDDAAKKKAADAKKLKDFYAADAREVEQNRKRSQRENRQKAEEAVPGLNANAERAVGMGVLNGMSMDKIGKQLAFEIQKKTGGSKEEAEATAKDVMDDAKKNVRDKAVKRALSGKDMADADGSARSMSEVMATSSLTARIQSGVGTGGEAKKQTTLQEAMEKSLAALATRSGLVIGVEN